MPDIELHLKKKLFLPKFFPYLLDYSHRFEFWMGGAGSGKSYTITQKLVIRACKEPIRIAVCRKFGSTIRQTVFSLFKEVLTKWKLTPYVKINESDYRIRFINGSEIIFLGLDEETKLLSLNDIGTIFVEEAFEVPQSMVEQLNLRMRGKNPNQQLILAWNPINKNSWLYDFSVVNPPDNSIFIHSTFLDNPFLSEEYVASIKELESRNPLKWRVYGLGEWGIDPEGLVFTNWRAQDFNVNDLIASGLEHRCGMDFGYRDPTAVVESFWDEQNKKIYVCNEFYKSGCQLDDIYNAIVDMGLTKSKIYGDSAEPRTLDYLRRKQINACPCIKGQDSVEARIAFLQNHTIIVAPHCKSVINELENFAYEKNKAGEYTNKTTHEYSHSLDALGYAYSDIYTKTKLRTLDKSILGL